MVFSKGQRLAGAHIHFPEIQFAICFDHGFDIIEGTHANTGGGDDDIRIFLHSPFQAGADICFRIGSDTQPDQFDTRTFGQDGKNI